MEYTWTIEDLEKHFFIYLEKVDSHDSLFPLVNLSISNAELKTQKENFLYNIRLILNSVTAPFHTALSAGMHSQFELKEGILDKAKNGCDESMSVLLYLQKNKSYLVGIKAVIPTFEAYYKNDLRMDHFENLYKTSLIRFYGCLEELSKSILRIHIVNDLDLLDVLESNEIKIKDSKPSKLKSKILQSMRDENLSIDKAYNNIVFNKGYSILQYSEIFDTILDSDLTTKLNSISYLEFCRHLIVHKSSVVDKKFLDRTKSELEIGSTLIITPKDMYDWLDDIVKYTTILFQKSNHKNP